MIKGYVSLSHFTTLYYNQGEFDKYSKHLKLASLIYDVVILPVDVYTTDSFNSRIARSYGIPVNELSKTFVSEQSISNTLTSWVSEEIVEALNEFRESETNLFRTFSKALKNEFLQDGNFNSLEEMEDFEKKHSLSFGRDIGAAFMSAMSKALNWSIIGKQENCNYLSSNNSSIIVSTYLKNRKLKSSENVYSNIELLIPSISNITWDELFTIKKDKRVTAFREYINEKIYSDENSEQFAKDVLLDLWKAFNELKLDTKGEVFTGVLGNIPIPLVNPISIYSSAKSITKSIKINKDYKPILFLGHVNDELSKSNS